MRETSGRRVMRIMEGQGVDGHVGDESSSKRNAFVRVFENVSLFSLLFSLLSLSGLVLSCLVVWVCVLVCACVGVQHTPRSFPSAVSLRRAGVQQLYQVQRMIGGIGNVLFSTCSQTLNV